jgi:formylglycine-generating enzyme required for sulfatase activity
VKKAIFAVIALTLLASACAVPALPTPTKFETGVDSGAWAKVPAGSFLMSIHNHPTVINYDFEIMVTPVTNSQYAAYLNQAVTAGKVKVADGRVTGFYPGDRFHGYRHEVRIDAGDYLHYAVNDRDARLAHDGRAFTVKPGFENHPITGVTWFGAKAYCDFTGARLPTEEEWEKAARGIDGRPYPWGSDVSPANANYYYSRDPFEKGTGAIGLTTPVGFYNGKTYDGFATFDSKSPYGLYDMAGNVWHWTASFYEGLHDRYLRGGSHADPAFNARAWWRNSARPDYFSFSVGFRAARDVKK